MAWCHQAHNFHQKTGLSNDHPVRYHNDVIKWKHFPRHWPFVRGIHRWPVNSPLKGQWRGALMFSLINGWINNRKAADLRSHRAHYDVIVMHFDLRIHSTGSRCAVAIVRRAREFGPLSFAHLHYALVPTFDDLSRADFKLEVLPSVTWWIKLLSISQGTWGVIQWPVFWYSLSRRTAYREISWSLEDARLTTRLFQ